MGIERTDYSALGLELMALTPSLAQLLQTFSRLSFVARRWGTTVTDTGTLFTGWDWKWRVGWLKRVWRK